MIRSFIKKCGSLRVGYSKNTQAGNLREGKKKAEVHRWGRENFRGLCGCVRQETHPSYCNWVDGTKGLTF